MIAANVATAQFLERQRLPVAAARAALARALGPHRRAGRRARRAAARRSPSAPALQQFLARRRQADPVRFADLSLSVVKLLGSGEYAVELPGGSRGRPLRPRGEGLHALHGAEPPLPGPGHAAPRQGGARRDAPLRTRRTSWTELARHCTAQEDNATKVERQVRKSAAALLLASRVGRALRRDRHRRLAEGDLGAHLPPGGGGAARARRAGTRRRRPRSAWSCVRTDVERGFIDFARA